MGCFVGLGSGIWRSAPPALFAAFAGFQWFTLGSTFVGKTPAILVMLLVANVYQLHEVFSIMHGVVRRTSDLGTKSSRVQQLVVSLAWLEV